MATFYRLCLGVLIIFYLSDLSAQPEPLRVMTFNIRLNTADDGLNAWPHRKDLVASMIKFYDADIVGLQEAMRNQLDDLSQLLPEYTWFGVSRTDGSIDPEPDNEFSAILYRKDRLQREKGETFWLSDEPTAVGKAGWDAALPRIVTWALFRDLRNGRSFYHFNTHFDHRGEEARRESARLIRQQVSSLAGDAPVIVTGDFNAPPESPPYQTITDPAAKDRLTDAMTVSELPHHGPLSTWSGFTFPGTPGRRIDYIFVKNGVRVLRHAILSDSWSGRFPSDHLPVLAEVTW